MYILKCFQVSDLRTSLTLGFWMLNMNLVYLFGNIGKQLNTLK